MNSKAPIYIFVASVVVAIGMLVFAVNRAGSQESAPSEEQTQEIAALKQSISELQQTVKKQSRVIEQLSNGTVTVDEGGTTEPLDSSFAGGEELWAVMEPFVEQHMEDREVRKREEAMAKSRERRNEQLAEQLGLNPFQAEQLAKVRADFKQRRDDMFKVGVGITNPQELPEKLNVIKEEKQQALAGFLTADQLEKYNKHHGSTRVFSFAGDGQNGIAGAVGRALNFSINIPDGEAGPVPEIQAITIDASAEGAPVFLNGGDGAAVIQSETRIISPAGGEAIIIRSDEPPTPEE